MVFNDSTIVRFEDVSGSRILPSHPHPHPLLSYTLRVSFIIQRGFESELSIGNQGSFQKEKTSKL